MAISLQKGGNISLSKEDLGLKLLNLGLGWDPRATDGQEFDLDALAFCLDANGKVPSENHFVFYGNLSLLDGTVKHSGDNRTGNGDGDDETISVDLPNLSPEIQKIVLAVSIHQAVERGQNFGQVSNAYIRCVNKETNKEIARFDLSEDASTETVMIFGEIYRHNNEWKFRAVGQGYAQGLTALVESYGLSVKQ